MRRVFAPYGTYTIEGRRVTFEGDEEQRRFIELMCLRNMVWPTGVPPPSGFRFVDPTMAE